MAGLGTPLHSQPRNYPPSNEQRASEMETASLQRILHYNEVSFFFFFGRGACERAGEIPAAGATAARARGGLCRPAWGEMLHFGTSPRAERPPSLRSGGLVLLSEHFEPSPRSCGASSKQTSWLRTTAPFASQPRHLFLLALTQPPNLLLEAPPSPSPTPPAPLQSPP